jgi:hypothetical protein
MRCRMRDMIESGEECDGSGWMTCEEEEEKKKKKKKKKNMIDPTVSRGVLIEGRKSS